MDGIPHEDPIVLCNDKHRFLVADQLNDIGFTDGQIILEPVARNTAPAIALAALKALGDGEDPLLLVLAADHLIRPAQLFHRVIENAIKIAMDGQLATFGIIPIRPETGYGYIRKGAPIGDAGFKVESFKEKPDLETAKSYIESDEYYWNGGMFLFRASRFLEELEEHSPDILKHCTAAIEHSVQETDFCRANKDSFISCPADSIDYAVMEKTTHAAVVPMDDVEWHDMGSWASLWELDDKIDNGNACRGDTVMIDTKNCLVHADSKLVATIGLEDTVIIETKDAVLVANRHQAQEVKAIVDQLKVKDRYEVLHHRQVYRPWGHYDLIDRGNRYKVKRIFVNPGAKLSTQTHFHRSEHWIVVSGTARVQKDDEFFLITENESTYIPVGVIHSLENPGKIPLEIIEVQSGPYLGENDIVRHEDRYGRKQET